ncbi:MAG: hypothetical protein QF819_02270 [Gemmatimonadota bacterium]|nr:hypothetical protein [Gemmatimonadota bacterium]MDP6530087.1 hypothetical protein [Gemmatimonadota bacterium]MDP6801985.1 hypothetical protein [Gemmatimonadota bacterium]MDP7031333.1 hypothetical protein [Gemmatimonadota bacterium]
MRRLLPVLGLLAVAPGAAHSMEVAPYAGVGLEYFGETYQTTEDSDTVLTVSDRGAFLGVRLRTPSSGRDRFQLDAEARFGRSTNRFAMDFDGQIRRGRHRLRVNHRGTVRVFREGGDYEISSDSVQDDLSLSWRCDLGGGLEARVKESVDVTWYEDPDEYNLNSSRLRTGAELRWDFGDLNTAGVGYRYGRRSVPDSTSLGYGRSTFDTDLSLLFGASSSADIANRLERRIYNANSVRGDSWENRLDGEVIVGLPAGYEVGVVHESEVVRFDVPDDLDFDHEFFRHGLRLGVPLDKGLDLSFMPVLSTLRSDTASGEEYTEVSAEIGATWWIGDQAWITVTDEVGLRNYTVEGSGVETDYSTEVFYTDYTFNRATILLSWDPHPGISVHVFGHWFPEDHKDPLDNSETTLLSGEVEYAF